MIRLEQASAGRRSRPVDSRPRTRAATALALVAALVVYAVLLHVDRSSVEDLRPRPDALEYEEAARSLAEGDGYALVIAGGRYPPRYPPGLSLLIAPVLYFADHGPGTGIVVVLACALATILAAWTLGNVAGGRVVAFAAACLVASSPVFVKWTRAVMSDVPSAAATTWILVAAGSALRRPDSNALWLVLGALSGLTTLLRATNALVILAVAGAALMVKESSLGRRLAWVALGFAGGLAPLLLYDTWRFGSPLATGYDFYGAGRYFALEFLYRPPASGGSTPNPWYYSRALAGFGDVWSWPAAALVGLGLTEAARRAGLQLRIAAMLLLFVLPLLAAYMAFFWQDTRFLVVVLPPLACLGGLPFAAEAAKPVRWSALALAGIGIWLAWHAPELYAQPQPAREPTLLRELDVVLPDNAALLAHATEPFVRRILRRPGTDRIWVPIYMDDHQLLIRLARVSPEAPARDRGAWIRQGLDADSAVRMAHELLAQGRPVFLSTMLPQPTATLPKVLAALARSFRLDPIATPGHGQHVLRVRERSDPDPR